MSTSLTNTTDFYNAGTDALARGNLGEAVLFLRAASRLEPRADDVARNLAIAEARVALERGEGPTHVASRGGFALSSGEAWLLAAVLVAAGIVGLLARWRRIMRSLALPTAAQAPRIARGRASLALDVAGIAGLAVMAWLLGAATVSRLAPEGVVLDESLPLTAASGQPLPDSPALVAGERVRLGPERDGLVEIRLGGTSVGWARRSGVWKVSDASRYTLPSSTERSTSHGGFHG